MGWKGVKGGGKGVRVGEKGKLGGGPKTLWGGGEGGGGQSSGDAAFFTAFDSIATLDGFASLAMTSVGKFAHVCLPTKQANDRLQYML